MAKEKKEKEKKTIEQRAKGFKIRGIIYASLLIVFILCSVIFNHTSLHDRVFVANVPDSIVKILSDGTEMTFYADKVKSGEEDKVAKYIQVYYYETDENGEEVRVDLSNGRYYTEDGINNPVAMDFNIRGQAAVTVVNGVLKALRNIMIIILIVLAVTLY